VSSLPPLFIQWIRLRDDIGTIGLFFYQWIKTSKIPDIQYIRTRKSPIERRLYTALKQAGFRVKTQYAMGAYRCDLAIPRYKLVIECDGESFHNSKKQKARDRKKAYYIRRKHKWKLLRFTGSQINRDVGKCVEKIQTAIHTK
jgi:very-short-patch-repair endonuclease